MRAQVPFQPRPQLSNPARLLEGSVRRPAGTVHSSSRSRLVLGLGTVGLSLSLLLLPGVASSMSTALTFDLSEIGAATPQPVNGLGSVMGVSFDFTLSGSPSDLAEYGVDNPLGTGGENVTAFVDPPTLEGDAGGILTFLFDNPVTSLSFDVAMDDIFAVEGFTVELFDTGDPPTGGGGTAVDIAVQPGGNTWAEGSFSYAGPTAVTRAVIDFNEDTFFRTIFWLDNLSYVTVPEPGTGLLLGLGMAGLVVATPRRRR